MYEIDEKDEVIPLVGLPQSDVGSPRPVVVADEHTLSVCYFIQTREAWDETPGEPAAVVSFERCISMMFGAPNDEAFSGHPLADRGLKSYAAFEVRNSSWVRKLDRMNSVHPQHRAGSWAASFRHFILTFHDSTFECVAEGFRLRVVQCTEGSLATIAAEIAGGLR